MRDCCCMSLRCFLELLPAALAATMDSPGVSVGKHGGIRVCYFAVLGVCVSCDDDTVAVVVM